jgi:hypothetical protein
MRKTNEVIQLMRRGKKYKLMELVEKYQSSRQYVNFVLNEGIKSGIILREGTRKKYIYTKIIKTI